MAAAVGHYLAFTWLGLAWIIRGLVCGGDTGDSGD
jgi:hypothetical protein